ncbi:hypothetical protein MGWOODY_Smn2634 [hydrothermal vent metagenome]|uniref:Uncharacterized protein n=1 Tax=hydrothermal vent metagenome TaxID=652676 RepID=A0A161K506_9ZZZZ
MTGEAWSTTGKRGISTPLAWADPRPEGASSCPSYRRSALPSCCFPTSPSST